MQKFFVLILLMVLSMSKGKAQEGTIYQFSVKTIDGDTISLAQFKGKKVMIVNTASKCGFTPQYEQLEAIYEKYKSDSLVVIGFPCNQFLGQAPGTDKEIKAFCTKNYGVTFPMMAKIDVKGRDQLPLYKFLTTKKLNGLKNSRVHWNFQKYLVGKDGKLEKVFYSPTKPNDPEIIKWIESN